MASVASTSAADAASVAAVAQVVRVMFPHSSFPDGPYERCASAIVEAGGEDVRWRAQLEQGLRDLDVVGGAPFASLDPSVALDVLRGMSATEFFQGIRSRVITTLYDDREVWKILGYEGPSFESGGYLHRGFGDLDWLPEPRIEEASS
jgi:hypothetical protein